MNFFKRLFSGGSKEPAADPLRGVEVDQTQEEQDTTRKRMESDVAADREHRGASDTRPNGEQSPAKDA